MEAEGQRELYHYLMVLPLLHYREGGFTPTTLAFLPDWMRIPANMGILQGFCLMHAGRIDAAVGLARTEAKWAGKPFDAKAYLTASGEQCHESRRVDLAVACLRAAKALMTPRSDEATNTHFRMVEILSDARTAALAAGECKLLLDELADKKPHEWGRAAVLRITYLAKTDLGAALREIGPFLKDPALGPHRLQLLHLKWKLLRQDGKGEEAARVMKVFLKDYRADPLAAEMYYAVATDCLAQPRGRTGETTARKAAQIHQTAAQEGLSGHEAPVRP